MYSNAKPRNELIRACCATGVLACGLSLVSCTPKARMGASQYSSVTGTVIDVTKRETISEVEVNRGGKLIGRSNRDGYYEFELIEADTCSFTFSHSGFSPTQEIRFPRHFNKVDAHRYVLNIGMVPTDYQPSPEDPNVGITYDEWMRLSNLQFDCNRNNIYDQDEIDQGKLEDVNKNGIPDVCED